jgi:rare lipoprotein A
VTPTAAPGPSATRSPANAETGRSDAGRTYEVFGREYRVLDSAEGYVEEGLASWYGEKFHGRPTASGERYDMHSLSAAHRTLPLHTWVEVTNLQNGRSLVVKVNDRGPFARTGERILDLSYGAARELDVVAAGTARVRVRALSAGELEEMR